MTSSPDNSSDSYRTDPESITGKRKNWIALLVLIAPFIVTALLIILGRFGLSIDSAALQNWFGWGADTVWAFPLTVLIFIVGAFLGLPQWALIAAATFTFGPLLGAVYAYISTLLSACVGFSVGRHFGAERLHGFGVQARNRSIDFIKRYGFWAAMIVRLVPSGPFVMINLAGGVSGMRFAVFLMGTAIGIIPKIAGIAFFGQTILSGLSGNFGMVIAMILIGIAIILALRFWRRKYLSSYTE